MTHMATKSHNNNPIRHSSQISQEKENQRPDHFVPQHKKSNNSGSSGSVPKRYRSVFTESTPISAFGIRKEDNQPRSRSPSNRQQVRLDRRPLKPVREFLATSPSSDQQTHDHPRSISSTQMNGFNRAQTEATMQNVDAALAKALNKLRPAQLNAHSNPVHVETSPLRPVTARSATPFISNGINSNPIYYYNQNNGMKAPLPADLIHRRSTNKGSDSVQNQNRPMMINPLHTQQGSIETIQSPRKNNETDKGQIHGVQPNGIGQKETSDKSKRVTINLVSNSQQSNRKRSPGINSGLIERQQTSLPEVSVNPQLETPVQSNGIQILTIYENIPNGEMPGNRHHIRVEPTETFRSVSSPHKQSNLADVKPNVIIQHQRPSSSSSYRPSSAERMLATDNEDNLNDAYVDRNQPLTHLPVKQNDTDETQSTLNQNENQQELTLTSSSPVTEELEQVLKKSVQKYSMSSATNAAQNHKKNRRPPGRLKNYQDESDSELTATDIQNMPERRGRLPSDLGSDAWSDLASEFSDTKLRKNPNIRTSTPNMTRQSSSISSKEVLQIRKQLSDLQMMYHDLLKLLDIDLDSVRSSAKSNTSSQVDHHSRKHRFRKVAPVTSTRQSNIDMKEIHQRFTRVESSIVTLAESIAKLSGQVQMQKTLKDDVHHLREEVAELRQQIYQTRLPPLVSPSIGVSLTPQSGTGQTFPRLIPPHPSRLHNQNNSNPLNSSGSYTPSPSITPRANSIIDPRQAKKIEQFFGVDAMLRYFLSLLQYEQYAPILEREKIGIYELPYVNERRLQSLGIPYGPCARIIFEAQQYFISLLTLKSSGIEV